MIILSAKPVPEGRVNDPYLAEKLTEEIEGIFLWALRGLRRLIANDYKFTISEKTRDNLAQMKEDNCNIISLLKKVENRSSGKRARGYIGIETTYRSYIA